MKLPRQTVIGIGTYTVRDIDGDRGVIQCRGVTIRVKLVNVDHLGRRTWRRTDERDDT